ncbi:hypothetical protein [uncultured Roseobacter sp.]|uniref:hypothetical protein n=1 Tax=uncultured Roseobacter sp. TaxID=114847 RepID=UPI00262808B8|nr:hypothetical protein [uncultured Roseobacter sp.]
MSDTSKRHPVTSSGTSVAKQHVPEGRLSPDQSAAPAFEDAGEKTTTVDAASAVVRDEAEGGGDADRFETIKAECRYCGRSLDMDPSL